LIDDRVSYYIIINQYEQAFIGLKGGTLQWSTDIDKAKPYNEDSKIKGMLSFCPEYTLEKMEI
jgi:hypothetical protein